MPASLDWEAIGAAIAAAFLAIGGIFKGAQILNRREPEASRAEGSAANPFLLIDYKRVEMAVAEMGAVQGVLLKLNATVNRLDERLEATERDWRNNTEAAEAVAREAIELRYTIRALADALNRRPGG